MTNDERKTLRRLLQDADHAAHVVTLRCRVTQGLTQLAIQQLEPLLTELQATLDRSVAQQQALEQLHAEIRNRLIAVA